MRFYTDKPKSIEDKLRIVLTYSDPLMQAAEEKMRVGKCTEAIKKHIQGFFDGLMSFEDYCRISDMTPEELEGYAVSLMRK